MKSKDYIIVLVVIVTLVMFGVYFGHVTTNEVWKRRLVEDGLAEYDENGEWRLKK